MKFYFLPHIRGHVSFSKNHYTVYNSFQQATEKNPHDKAIIRRRITHFQHNSVININIERYHVSSDTNFHTYYSDESEWIIT